MRYYGHLDEDGVYEDGRSRPNLTGNLEAKVIGISWRLDVGDKGEENRHFIFYPFE